MNNPAAASAARTNRSLWIAGFALALLALRVLYAYTLKVNSDEPQHLHVAWQWAQGWLPYRDFFDNHTPLFHMLYAPLLAMLGERSDIVFLMRLGMLPLYAGSLWLVWFMGSRLWSPRVGLAAAALIGLQPTYFQLSLQFRTDNLWALLWLAMMAVLVSGKLRFGRGLVAGVLAGAALATSMKSLLLFGTAALAALIVYGMLAIRSGQWRRCLPLRGLAGFGIGVVLVPALLAAWFATHGAWSAMLYGLFEHNVVADIGRWENPWIFLLGPLTLPPALWLAWRSRSKNVAGWAPRAFLILAAVGYTVALYGYWPLFTRQSLLPVTPLLVLAIVAGIVSLQARLAPRWQGFFRALLPSLLVLELLVLIVGTPPWKNDAQKFEQTLATTLRIGHPGDYVMDAKGESVFRQRPIYWVLESITQARMHDGSIVDDIAEQLQKTATPVVVMNRLPPAALAFVQKNYIEVAPAIRVAGQLLGRLAEGESARFTVAVPLSYVIVDASGLASGDIDGMAATAAVRLAAGEHSFRAQKAGAYALVWAPALERGVDVATLFHAAVP